MTEHDAGGTGRRLILVAEDDPSAASVLETLLRLSGYDVVVAPDGAAALDALEARRAPDLVLLDWMLPEVSGLDVCRAARQRWDPVALPILMVTARADREGIAEAFEAGANDYLSKPFMGLELRARIESHLRIKQLVEEGRRTDELLMDREKLASLGLLVSSVAHDLNNPLAGIMAHSQLLLHDEGDPERRMLLSEIVSEVGRCNQIIGDLLGFVRRQPTEPQVFDAREVLVETLAMRERHLRSTGVRLQREIEELPMRVDGVAHQLQQVFLNIVLNAEQALRGRAGDTIRVRMRCRTPAPPPVPAGAGAHGQTAARADGGSDAGAGPAAPPAEVEVEIANNGPAIPADVAARIFDPFFTTKPPDEGTGLGLAIADRIVRDHGGTIEVHSTDEETVFRITLPVAPSDGDAGRAGC